METYTIGIALLLPEEYTSSIKKKSNYLSEKYNTQQGLFQPPHITLKSPFETKDLVVFEKYCEELAKGLRPFEIKVENYGFFESKVIFLKIVPSEKLMSLHLSILDDLKNKQGIKENNFEGVDKQFHITLAYGDLSPEMFYKAKEELENSEQPHFSFKFDSIGLLKFTGKEWAIHKVFKIKNDN